MRARRGSAACPRGNSTAGSPPRLEANPPPAPGGKRIKLRYITQAGVRPPTFVLFGTRTDQLPESYRRYLLNGIRSESWASAPSPCGCTCARPSIRSIGTALKTLFTLLPPIPRQQPTRRSVSR